MDLGIFPNNCLDNWIEENNCIVKKWECSEISQRANRHDTPKHCYNEFHNLLLKIQGVPPVAASVQLELTVLYNTLLLMVSLLKPREASELLIRGLVRALEALKSQAPSSDLPVLWPAVLQTFRGSCHLSRVHQLLCVQWALCLSTGEPEKIQALLPPDSPSETKSLSGSLLSVIQDFSVSSEEKPSLLVVMAPRELKELLHVCTVITQGIRRMEDGKEAEALQAFQEATSLPAPRVLLAQVHTLKGVCFSKMGRPQSSLQCYRNALEVDFGCKSALYQSALVYRKLDSSQAEVEALRLLRTAVMSCSSGESSATRATLVSPGSLLPSQALKHVFTVPDPLSLQHTLAQRCLLSGRTSEAVEGFLDLLASLQTETNLVAAGDSSTLPRISDIYLEAAFAMLKAERFWDSVAVCAEVINKTVDLVPARLRLEVPFDEHQDPGSTAPPYPEKEKLSGGREVVVERLNYVLWAGAALLLQGQAYHCLKESKEAITSFTRSINLLFKVQVKPEDRPLQGPTAVGVQTLQRLKGLALAGRGISFTGQGQDKAALRDLRLSLQAFPGVEDTELWLVQVLLKLGRKVDATSLWRRSQSSKESPLSVRTLPVYLQSYPLDRISVDPECLMKGLEPIHNRGTST